MGTFHVLFRLVFACVRFRFRGDSHSVSLFLIHIRLLFLPRKLATTYNTCPYEGTSRAGAVGWERTRLGDGTDAQADAVRCRYFTKMWRVPFAGPAPGAGFNADRIRRQLNSESHPQESYQTILWESLVGRTQPPSPLFLRLFYQKLSTAEA